MDRIEGQHLGKGETRTRSYWLDVLRVVLCAGVVLHHYIWIPTGPMAVDGFFVLSGYLLAASFNKISIRGGLDVCSFYASKVQRLLPAFIIGMFMGGAYKITFCITHNIPETFMTWSGSDFRLVMLAHFYNPPAWFLMCEFAFLVCAPLLFWIFTKGQKSILAVTLIGMGFSYLLYTNVPYNCYVGDGLYYEVQVRFWQFTAGMVSWMVLKPICQKHNLRYTALMLLLGVVLCNAIPFMPGGDILNKICFTFAYDASMVFIFAVLIPMLDSITIGSTFGRPVIYKLSVLTYPVFLFHFPVIQWITAGLYSVLPPYATILTATTVTIIISFLYQLYVDPLFSKKAKNAQVQK